MEFARSNLQTLKALSGFLSHDNVEQYFLTVRLETAVDMPVIM